jgi:hypothetical protein
MTLGLGLLSNSDALFNCCDVNCAVTPYPMPANSCLLTYAGACEVCRRRGYKKCAQRVAYLSTRGARPRRTVRRPKVQKTPQAKWQIVLEGLKSGNIAEACRRCEIAFALYHRWKTAGKTKWSRPQWRRLGDKCRRAA